MRKKPVFAHGKKDRKNNDERFLAKIEKRNLFARHWTGVIGKFLNTKNAEEPAKQVITMEFLLEHAEPINNDVHELSKVLLARFGLIPRKKDGSAKMHTLLLELNERKKVANRERTPETAVMPVEEMALHAGIKRQTMYDYLHRWLDLQILKKTSFVSSGKVVVGYELNGPTVEAAFRKAETALKNHLDLSFTILEKMQNEIKKEKLRDSSVSSTSAAHPNQPGSSSPAPDGTPSPK